MYIHMCISTPLRTRCAGEQVLSVRADPQPECCISSDGGDCSVVRADVRRVKVGVFPVPEHLKIDGEWEDAVKQALKKPPPPKPETKEPPPKKRPQPLSSAANTFVECLGQALANAELAAKLLFPLEQQARAKETRVPEYGK